MISTMLSVWLVCFMISTMLFVWLVCRMLSVWLVVFSRVKRIIAASGHIPRQHKNGATEYLRTTTPVAFCVRVHGLSDQPLEHFEVTLAHNDRFADVQPSHISVAVFTGERVAQRSDCDSFCGSKCI